MREVSAEVPSFPPPRSCPFDPPDLYAEKRLEEPIFKMRVWNGNAAWVVTRYRDGRALLTDKRLSADSLMPDLPHQSEAVGTFRRHRNFIGMDVPEHRYYRRMIADDFGPKHMHRIRPAVRAIIDAQLDAMESMGGQADLIADFALPVTSTVICELLGVPYEAHELFERLAGVLLSTVATAQDAADANAEVWKFLSAEFERKTAVQEDDVLSHLAAEVRDGRLTRAEGINTAYLLLIAGHETTAGQIGLGALTLMQHPDQLAEILADPALVDNAVEEVLRYIGVSQAGRRRIALADIEYGDVLIKKGDGVIVLGGSANRDAEIFDDPDRFDIHRANAAQHVEFGAGTHICLGRPLARMELQLVFESLFQRFPTLEAAAAVAELSFKYDATVYGLHAFPVKW